MVRFGIEIVKMKSVKVSLLSLALVATSVVAVSCKTTNNNAIASASDVSSVDAASVGTTPAATQTAPENMVATIRGTMLRRAIPMLFPGPSIDEVIGSGVPQLTPGAGTIARHIDPESPFAVVSVVVESSTENPLKWLAAWPLKPGLGITTEAREGRGWRTVSEGVYAPTSADAGAETDEPCWLARRAPVGWMALCGPREILARSASWLRLQGSNAPDNSPILDLDLRAGILGRMSRRTLAALDEQAPPRATSGEAALRRAMFEQVRRQQSLLTSIASDIDNVRGALTQDENAMHLLLTATVSRASSDQTRFLLDSAANRQASSELLTALPASTQAWILSGFDRDKITSALGAAVPDIMVQAQAGPEFARVKGLLDELSSVMPPASRVDAYTPDEGHTMVRIIRRADAERFVDDFRVAVQSLPARQISPFATLRDMAMVMPTPGITGHVLRIGQNIRIPAGTRVSPEERAQIAEQVSRSLLIVAVGDRITVVQGREPVARYRALLAGTHLAGTVPANAVLAGRMTLGSFAPMFYGQAMPGIPADTEGLDFSFSVVRRGEGATLTLRADGPIGVATGLRQLYASIEAQRAQQMQQMQQQMQQQQQQQQQMRQQGGPGGPGGAPRRPMLDPSSLPEPPAIQLGGGRQ